MKNSLRALPAVALMTGFPVLVVAIIAAMVSAEIFAFRTGLSAGLCLAILVVPSIYAQLRFLLLLERSGGRPPGLAVTPEEHPELWALVCELAQEIGTRPPDEIYLVARVSASVHEQTRLLGWRVRRRWMAIGASLFAGLPVSQLRAILGRELGHYRETDARFADVAFRGRQSIWRLGLRLSRPTGSDWLVRPVVAIYAALYLAASTRLSRGRELDADSSAAQVGGTAAATAALREIEVLTNAWQIFSKEYLMAAYTAGYLPQQIAGGYQRLLADETRAAEMAELRQNPPARRRPRFDSCPPLPVRIAALEAAPTVPVPPGGDRPATELLRDAPATLEAAIHAALTKDGLAKQRLDWPSLIDVGMRKSVQDEAVRILRRRGLEDLLDALDAGRPDKASGPDKRPPPGIDRTELPAFHRIAAHRRLAAVVHARLAETGAARWELSWSGPPRLVLAETYAELPRALDAAIGGDTAPLRALLAR